ncbi:hypothetical protein GCM10007424_01330 [Flavobacterium suaedae]|uniref:SH3b domain-containing protein n=1 Tax=Flavobacterium suaedae TaxID=1767027 RepID=A0ABQ1JC52_9FLAO|nr:SH3 domain-containing protein [Flavobacterium suaedae]GGB65155.1 hypothetical protein GCM10007424_01330 [Flavobacterium suaedae]
MKLLNLTLLFLFLSITSFSQESKLIASCCENKETKSFGRCSGNAYCTACTNCRYCKHCNNGGTCGVCASYNKPKKTTSKSYSSTTNYKLPSSYSFGDKLIISSEALNLRAGAGTSYDVVEKLTKGDILTFLSYDGDWIEVRVVESGNKGYVYFKYVK